MPAVFCWAGKKTQAISDRRLAYRFFLCFKISVVCGHVIHFIFNGYFTVNCKTVVSCGVFGYYNHVKYNQ